MNDRSAKLSRDILEFVSEKDGDTTFCVESFEGTRIGFYLDGLAESKKAIELFQAEEVVWVVTRFLPDELSDDLSESLITFYSRRFVYLPPLFETAPESNVEESETGSGVLVVWYSEDVAEPSEHFARESSGQLIEESFRYSDFVHPFAKVDGFRVVDLATQPLDISLFEGVSLCVSCIQDLTTVTELAILSACSGARFTLWSGLRYSPARFFLLGLNCPDVLCDGVLQARELVTKIKRIAEEELNHFVSRECFSWALPQMSMDSFSERLSVYLSGTMGEKKGDAICEHTQAGLDLIYKKVPDVSRWWVDDVVVARVVPNARYLLASDDKSFWRLRIYQNVFEAELRAVPDSSLRVVLNGLRRLLAPKCIRLLLSLNPRYEYSRVFHACARHYDWWQQTCEEVVADLYEQKENMMGAWSRLGAGVLYHDQFRNNADGQSLEKAESYFLSDIEGAQECPFERRRRVLLPFWAYESVEDRVQVLEQLAKKQLAVVDVFGYLGQLLVQMGLKKDALEVLQAGYKNTSLEGGAYAPYLRLLSWAERYDEADAVRRFCLEEKSISELLVWIAVLGGISDRLKFSIFEPESSTRCIDLAKKGIAYFKESGELIGANDTILYLTTHFCCVTKDWNILSDIPLERMSVSGRVRTVLPIILKGEHELAKKFWGVCSLEELSLGIDIQHWSVSAVLLGRKEDARRGFERLVKCHPFYFSRSGNSDPVTFLLQAIAFKFLGDLEESQKYLSIANGFAGTVSNLQVGIDKGTAEIEFVATLKDCVDIY